jgi:sporulation protein YlmC with PRC-barrel domain
MAEILAENLSGKSVMGTDGAELGLLYNITMDLKSGELDELVIQPDENTPAGMGMDRDENGRFRVPIGDVQAVKDYIVVSR